MKSDLKTSNSINLLASEVHEDHNVKGITIKDKDGIRADFCTDCKSIISYYFAKDKWTKSNARTWIKEQDKIVKEAISECYFRRNEESGEPFPSDFDKVFPAYFGGLSREEVIAIREAAPPLFMERIYDVLFNALRNHEMTRSKAADILNVSWDRLYDLWDQWKERKNDGTKSGNFKDILKDDPV